MASRCVPITDALWPYVAKQTQKQTFYLDWTLWWGGVRGNSCCPQAHAVKVCPNYWCSVAICRETDAETVVFFLLHFRSTFTEFPPSSIGQTWRAEIAHFSEEIESWWYQLHAADKPIRGQYPGHVTNKRPESRWYQLHATDKGDNQTVTFTLPASFWGTFNKIWLFATSIITQRRQFKLI